MMVTESGKRLSWALSLAGCRAALHTMAIARSGQPHSYSHLSATSSRPVRLDPSRHDTACPSSEPKSVAQFPLLITCSQLPVAVIDGITSSQLSSNASQPEHTSSYFAAGHAPL